MKIFDFQQVIHHLLSLQKKMCPTAAVIVAFTVFEIKKTKNFMKLEYIFYTMTLDYKKKWKCNQMADFWKKIFNFAQKSDGFWPGKIIFSVQLQNRRVIVYQNKYTIS